MLKEKNDKTFIEKHTKMIKESDEKIEKILNIISIIMEELKLKENEGYTGKMVRLFNYNVHSTSLTKTYLSEHQDFLLKEQQNKKSILDNFEKNKTINSSLLEEFKETNIKTLFDELEIDLEKITVKELFSNIWKYISDTSKNCENIKFINRFKWLVRFVDIIETSNILLYNRELKKKLK